MVFAYLAPDTFLPLTSVVAAVVGVVLTFGRASVRMVVNGFRAILAGRKADARASGGLKGQHLPGRLRRHARDGGRSEPEEAGQHA